MRCLTVLVSLTAFAIDATIATPFKPRPFDANHGHHEGQGAEFGPDDHEGGAPEWSTGVAADRGPEWAHTDAWTRPVVDVSSTYATYEHGWTADAHATDSREPTATHSLEWVKNTYTAHEPPWMTATRVASSSTSDISILMSGVSDTSLSASSFSSLGVAAGASALKTSTVGTSALASPSSSADTDNSGSSSSAAGTGAPAVASSETLTSILEAYESLYIVPNHGTDMYDKGTAPQAWTTPPCTTTVTSVTATPTCISPTYQRNYQASAPTAAASPESTSSPGQTSSISKRLLDLFSPKKSSAERNTAPVAAPKFERRALTLQPGEGSIAAGREEPNPVRQYAMGIGAGNFETAVHDSITAFLSAAGVTSLWLKLESKGNPFTTYYVNNGHGLPALAVINEAVASAANSAGVGAAGNAVTTAVGAVGSAVGDSASKAAGAVNSAAPAPPPVGDAGPALLSMMGQYYGTTYVVPSASMGTTATATSSVSSAAARTTVQGSATGSSATRATSSAKSTSTRSSTRSVATLSSTVKASVAGSSTAPRGTTVSTSIALTGPTSFVIGSSSTTRSPSSTARSPSSTLTKAVSTTSK